MRVRFPTRSGPMEWVPNVIFEPLASAFTGARDLVRSFPISLVVRLRKSEKSCLDRRFGALGSAELDREPYVPPVDGADGRIPVVSQIEEEILFNSCSCSTDVELKEPSRVFTQYLVFHLCG
jgi:hypothetical protein